MNLAEHLLTCLGEEGSEISQDVCKSLRFGLDDRNVLNPTGPTNRERLINELNDLIAVADMLVDLRVLPYDWRDENKQTEKKRKVAVFVDYAWSVGTLQSEETK